MQHLNHLWLFRDERREKGGKEGPREGKDGGPNWYLLNYPICPFITLSVPLVVASTSLFLSWISRLSQNFFTLISRLRRDIIVVIIIVYIVVSIVLDVVIFVFVLVSFARLLYSPCRCEPAGLVS